MRFAVGFVACSISTVAGDFVCSEAIVATATSQNFLGFIQNCLQIDAVGPDVCLARFIASNAVGNENPITAGACRDAYQTIVDTWSGTGSLIDCDPIAEGQTYPDLNCILGNLSASMGPFYASTGYYPMYPQCTFAEVRHCAELNSYANLVNVGNVNSYSGPIWSPFDVSAICDVCYFAFLSTINPIGVPSVSTACADDPEAVECISSTIIVDARTTFANCAGFDILTMGPICSSDEVAAAEFSVPQPYYAFVQCAYSPNSSFCPTLGSYSAELQTATSSNCSLCYSEFQASVLAGVSTESQAFCGTDVFSDECTTYNAASLAAFEVCSGSTLNIDPPTTTTVAAVTTVVTTTTTTTTATTTTTVPTSVASTTTKASSLAVTLGLLVIAAAIAL